MLVGVLGTIVHAFFSSESYTLVIFIYRGNRDSSVTFFNQKQSHSHVADNTLIMALCVGWIEIHKLEYPAVRSIHSCVELGAH